MPPLVSLIRQVKIFEGACRKLKRIFGGDVILITFNTAKKARDSKLLFDKNVLECPT